MFDRVISTQGTRANLQVCNCSVGTCPGTPTNGGIAPSGRSLLPFEGRVDSLFSVGMSSVHLEQLEHTEFSACLEYHNIPVAHQQHRMIDRSSSARSTLRLQVV